MAFTLGVGPTTGSHSGSTITLTLNGTTAGRSLIVGAVSSNQTISSVACSGGESNLTLHGSTDTGGGRHVQLASLASIVTGGNKTITITFTGTPGFSAGFAFEVAGGKTSSFFDVGAGAIGTSTTPSVGITTTNANALVVGITHCTGGGYSAGSGYTSISLTGSVGLGEYDLDAGAAGAKTVDFTVSSGDWAIRAAAFNVETDNPITPPVGSLTLSGVAPNVSKIIDTPAGGLTLAGAAPGVFAGQTIFEVAGALALSGVAPTLALSDIPITVPVGALTLAGVAPSALSVTEIIVPVGALTLAGVAPTRPPFGDVAWEPWLSEGLMIQGGQFTSDGVRWAAWRSEAVLSSPYVMSAAVAWEPWAAVGSFPFQASVEFAPWTATGRISELLQGAGTWAPWRKHNISGAPYWPAWVATARLQAATSEVYTTKVMNTRNTAVTEYTNYSFNSFAKIGDSYYGAGPNGLIRLSGITDNGSDIQWELRTGQMADESTKLKRLLEVLLSLRSNGPIRLRVYKDDNTYFDYTVPASKLSTINQQRAVVGKGMRSKYFMVELQGVNNSDLELDSMLVNMTEVKRRIG